MFSIWDICLSLNSSEKCSAGRVQPLLRKHQEGSVYLGLKKFSLYIGIFATSWFCWSGGEQNLVVITIFFYFGEKTIKIWPNYKTLKISYMYLVWWDLIEFGSNTIEVSIHIKHIPACQLDCVSANSS